MKNKKRKKIISQSENAGIFARMSLFFADNAKFTILFMVAIVAFGALSYTSLLRREGFPPVAVPVAVATGTYFVDDPSIIDAEITKPASDVIAKVNGVSSVSSFADSNFFQIVVNLEDGISSDEGTARVEAALQEEQVIPPDAQIQYLKIDAAKLLAKYDMLVSVYSTEGASAQQIEEQAVALAEQLSAADTVVSAEAERLFETGLNPSTGEQVIQQTSFGRFGAENEQMGFTYYPAAVIGINGASGDELDIFALSDSVKAELEKISIASGFSAAVSADFTDQVNTQINSLQANVITGLIAVTIISLIMISWRVSLLSVVFMISVIFVTSGILYLAGYTLNTITLFALVLSLGLFVDDATIISEAIDAAKTKDKTKREIIKTAVNAIGSASTAGTLTTVLVFVPLLFVSGIIGSFIYLLPVTVIIALLVSLFLSLTLIPFLAQFTILTDANIAKKSWVNPLPRLLERSILLLRTNRPKGYAVAFLMVSLSLVAVGASGFFAGKLSFNVFPSSKDSDQLAIQASFNPGTTIEEAEVLVDQLNEVIIEVVGENLVRSSYARESTPSSRSAIASIELTPFTSREIKSPEIIANLEARLVDFTSADLVVRQLDAGPPAEQFPFRMQINAGDFESAREAADAVSVYLDGRAITRQNGTTATVTKTRIDNLQNIVRKDSVRVVEVLAAYDADDVTALLQATQDEVAREFNNERLEPFDLTETDLRFDFGQESENEESFSSLGIVGLFALGTMLLLLTIQFRSVIKPLLIFLALPFSLLGVTVGLFVTNNPLSFFAMVGLIGLIGIAVNNTILLTDGANRLRAKGYAPIEAIAEATKVRFRPLITTTATTVAALAPLAMADPFWEPLAVTIMFGLVTSTLLVIFAFPYYYIAVTALTNEVVSLLKGRRA